MKDFVVYHNPDSMGYPASGIESLAVVTNNKIGDVHGGKVWLITGEGRPRKYFLVCWFIVDTVSSACDSGFKTRVSGTEGEVFDPMIPLDSEAEWFQAFRKNQGGFAFGFRAIKGSETVERLQELANSRS